MFGSSSTFDPNKDIPNLKGNVIIVTGGNVGLGLETIRQLAKHNPAHIYLAARSAEKAGAAIKQLKADNPNAAPISFLNLDLSSFDSIKAAAKTIQDSESRLDILVNNAGIMMVDEGLTKEGYEIQFGTNHLGPALFTQLLQPILSKTATINPETRVVNVSSASERVAPSDIYKFDEFKTTSPERHTTARYSTSKIANIHYTLALAERSKDVKYITVHPGMVATNLHHASAGFFLKAFLNAAIYFATPVDKGALSQIWAATSPEAKNGGCYAPTGVIWKCSKASQNHDLQEQLWNWTQKELKAHL
ncbi:hypothetical protein EYR41_012046 [Orbilia oligospora]|uniref:Uncharacterized protein n=1 Tax=Orbilia oligospora TaxID=2813651 RepID=A0A7C8P543_ORBOL|nr:hypothetical protein TWF751_004519 [Orbilia oligospora]KAF3256916.1 hypothetical protein TWF217_006230 [Orbilia oligospora]TGJ62867.1 hypothetical protein EYR41_012046 [Orbilia oligospora]